MVERRRNDGARTVSSRLYHFAGGYTARAHVGAAFPAVRQYPDPLDIRVPAPFVDIVGMADPVAEDRFFPADITFLRHSLYPPGPLKSGER